METMQSSSVEKRYQHFFTNIDATNNSSRHLLLFAGIGLEFLRASVKYLGAHICRRLQSDDASSNAFCISLYISGLHQLRGSPGWLWWPEFHSLFAIFHYLVFEFIGFCTYLDIHFIRIEVSFSDQSISLSVSLSTLWTLICLFV